jgi:hypothetical protein
MAEVVDQQNTSGTIDIGFGDVGSGRDYAVQGFIPTLNNITAIEFHPRSKDGNANIGWLVWIDNADANSNPTGTVNVGIGGATEITNASVTTGADNKVTLSAPVTVTPGQRYCMVFVPYNTSTNAKVNSYHDFRC